jgi:hypothetical protein
VSNGQQLAAKNLKDPQTLKIDPVGFDSSELLSNIALSVAYTLHHSIND